MIDGFPDLPPDTEPLTHQVAGHFYGRSKTKFGLLQRRSTGDVLKPLLSPPRGPREHKFYLEIFSEEISDELKKFREFLPQLLGSYTFEGMNYLILENIIRPFRYPSVIDIKVGRITYDQEATEEKIQRQMEKYRPATEIGFQLLGWINYRPTEKSYAYHDKRCARSLTKEELFHALAHFFGAPENDHRHVVRAVLERLVQLEQIMSKQSKYSFIATSLLIVYDIETEESNNRPLVDVRLVDFAHVFPSNEPDENFLFGLRWFIKYLETLINENFFYEPIEKFNHSDSFSLFMCSKTSVIDGAFHQSS